MNETWNVQLVRWCPAQCPAQSLQRRCLLVPPACHLASHLAVRLLPPINSPLAPLGAAPVAAQVVSAGMEPGTWNLQRAATATGGSDSWRQSPGAAAQGAIHYAIHLINQLELDA